MTTSLQPTEVGYLRRGAAGAVATAVAELRARKLVVMMRTRRLARSEQNVPGDISPLAAAVLASLNPPKPLGDLRSATAVRQALRTVDTTLTEAGLLTEQPRGLAKLATLATGRRTPAGKQLVAELRERHRDLKPSRHESAWNTATPEQVATSVALFGASALYDLDPVAGDGPGLRSSHNAEGSGGLG
ncbi:MAG: TIGR04222 domain-containing membrane protein [Micromonosporaceae bacterium]